jgi:meromycolic acid enoyl-[acyl-carrier-protein] reductase
MARRYLITGVLTRDSIAWTIARELQRRGDEILLTSFGRPRRLATRAAQLLDPVPDIVELDVADAESVAGLAGQVREHWDYVDGVLHAIAFAPGEAIGGRFLTTGAEDAEHTFRVSAFSLKEVTTALLPLLAASPTGASVVGLDFDASRAVQGYDWMGVAKAALEATTRYLACYLGPLGIRVNLLALGPLATTSSSGLGPFREWSQWFVDRAPLGWDVDDREIAAGPACFLLSEASRGTTGTILHVDGGYRIKEEPMPGLAPVDVSEFDRRALEEVS